MDSPSKLAVTVLLFAVLSGVAACSKTDQPSAGPVQPSSAPMAPAPSAAPATAASQPAAPASAGAATSPANGSIQTQDTPIKTQETNEEGVVGELIECRRSEGVLNIKVRFRNNSNKPAALTFTHWNATGFDNPKFYVTAGNKKYFMLADADGDVLGTNSTGNGVGANLDPGKTFLWWAKYPAPPAEVKNVNFMMPLTPPFEDVPITDK